MLGVPGEGGSAIGGPHAIPLLPAPGHESRVIAAAPGPGRTNRMPQFPVTLDAIRAARERIKDAIYHSPCPYSLLLSRLCGCEVYCKLDHLQVTGSFKERGARNKLLLLSPEARQRGVVAAS